MWCIARVTCLVCINNILWLHTGHFHKKGQITVKTWRSIFNPVGTRYLCISIDISMPFDTYVLEKIINAYNLYYY